MFSIVIPFEYHETRMPLLKVCLDSLTAPECEVCIVETGLGVTFERIKQFLPEKRFKYLKVFTTHSFNRAWSINVGVKYLATSDWILISDADLIYPVSYYKKLPQVNAPFIAWEIIYYLTKEATDSFLKSGHMVDRSSTDVRPNKFNAAGGAFWCPKELFFSVKGMPEKDFFGRGGEDNAFWMKLEVFGYKVRTVPLVLYHLWHPLTSAVNPERFSVFKMDSWTKKDWMAYQKTWGSLDGFDYFIEQSAKECSGNHLRNFTNLGG